MSCRQRVFFEEILISSVLLWLACGSILSLTRDEGSRWGHSAEWLMNVNSIMSLYIHKSLTAPDQVTKDTNNLVLRTQGGGRRQDLTSVFHFSSLTKRKWYQCDSKSEVFIFIFKYLRCPWSPCPYSFLYKGLNYLAGPSMCGKAWLVVLLKSLMSLPLACGSSSANLQDTIQGVERSTLGLGDI